MSEDIGPFERVAIKAGTEPEFKEQLLADPREAMKEAMGIVIPTDVTVNVVQNTAQELTIVLPYVVDEDLEFDDEDEVVGFSYHNANFSKNLKIDGPTVLGHHNPNFSQNVVSPRPQGMKMPGRLEG